VEVHKRFGLLQQPQIGGRSSGEEVKTSLTSITRRYSMFIKRRMLKDKNVLFIKDIMAGTKDGELSMLTKLPRLDQRDMTVNMDSTSIDHYSSDQDSQ
jgi:hypothetical protein